MNLNNGFELLLDKEDSLNNNRLYLFKNRNRINCVHWSQQHYLNMHQMEKRRDSRLFRLRRRLG